MSRVELHHASDGRALAMVVRADFDDFAGHPPTFATEEERAWLERHYRVSSAEVERETKAHLTDDEGPLQVVMLNRPRGAYVKPHYHLNDREIHSELRHQVTLCLRGRARIGVYAREGEHVADVDLAAGDFALLYEGHSIETLEDGTRLLEFKQGPMPEDPLGDNVPVPSTATAGS
jgi:hypothetical protein